MLCVKMLSMNVQLWSCYYALCVHIPSLIIPSSPAHADVLHLDSGTKTEERFYSVQSSKNLQEPRICRISGPIWDSKDSKESGFLRNLTIYIGFYIKVPTELVKMYQVPTQSPRRLILHTKIIIYISLLIFFLISST